MGFCKFSSEYIVDNKTAIDNAFINEFMVQAREDCVKVYLFGLLKCNTPDSIDNTPESFSRILNMSEEDIISAFMYWEDLGIIQVLSTNPLEVRYLPIKNGSVKLKKFNADKYRNFNTKVQEIISKRMIAPMEYQEYYYLIENMHMEEDALVMIIKYCVSLKGESIAYNYILAVAKNWAYQGVLTCADVEEHLLELEKSSDSVICVLKALGLTRKKATNEEYQLFLYWTKELEVSLDIILHIAKMNKRKGMGFHKLSTLIEKSYTLKLESIKEIEDYFSNLDNLYDLAKSVCKGLGIRYDSLDVVVDTYINNWTSLGFDRETLLKIANYCFKTSVRTLEGMNIKVNQLFKMGLLTPQSIDEHLENIIKNDSKIKDILEKLGIERMVNSNDRTLYKTWIYNWDISQELLNFAVENSADKYLPMQYLNKILSIYHTKGLKTVDDAKKENVFVGGETATKAKNNKKPTPRNYSAKELNSLFDNIFEVEI